MADVIHRGQLTLSGLTKRYSSATAVDAIDLVVERGEFLTLLGPSGSGKTTTLMMVAGFTPPSEGEISIDDHPITGIAPEHRNIGVVFQNYALFPHMTVFDNVAFPLRMRRHAKAAIRAQVGRTLDMVHLTGLGDRLPRQLSGGQQQRVALARALVFDPGLLLMDEPLGALDRNLREQMKLEIKRIHSDVGITVLYVFLPLSLPGVSAGCVLVFLLAVGFYITPALLGGEGQVTFSTLIELVVRDFLDWNFGASLGVFLLTVVGTLFVLFSTMLGLERLTGDSRA